MLARWAAAGWLMDGQLFTSDSAGPTDIANPDLQLNGGSGRPRSPAGSVGQARNWDKAEVALDGKVKRVPQGCGSTRLKVPASGALRPTSARP